jgi:hypothetical protein
VHEPLELVHTVRQALATTPLYAATVRRIVPRSRDAGDADVDFPGERPVFVVGSPRSGTSFLAGSLGRLPGFVDLGEVGPLKAALPRLASLPEADAATGLRRTIERIRRFGLARRLRAIEQTPETSFIVPAVVRAYPRAAIIHIIRDGRDVVCSLLERGWLGADRHDSDDVGAPYGVHARFWVEPDSAEEFSRASEARRAAWAWRRYVTAARSVPERTLEIRYEAMVTDPEGVAALIAEHIETDPELVAGALSDVFADSVGRWRRDLTSDQLADVEREAGPLLRELGYA